MAKDWHKRARDGLVVVLTVTTGGVDATVFLHLGHVFSSVITGTLVLLGVAAGTYDGALAAHCGVALGSYIIGVLVGTPLAARRTGRWLEGRLRGRRPQPSAHYEIWPGWLTVALGLEFCVLAGFSLGWELAGGRPAGMAQFLLLAAASVGMGIQSAAIRQLGDISTTYLTGTLTGVFAALAVGKIPSDLSRSLGIFVAVVLGAVAAALVTSYLPALLPLVILIPLALVVWFASARFGPRPSLSRSQDDGQPGPG
jgi:uncharacterized membrane protein YoaK (UPF0700 family)